MLTFEGMILVFVLNHINNSSHPVNIIKSIFHVITLFSNLPFFFFDLLFIYLFIYLFIHSFILSFSRAAPTAYGGSQVRV